MNFRNSRFEDLQILFRLEWKHDTNKVQNGLSLRLSILTKGYTRAGGNKPLAPTRNSLNTVNLNFHNNKT